MALLALLSAAVSASDSPSQWWVLFADKASPEGGRLPWPRPAALRPTPDLTAPLRPEYVSRLGEMGLVVVGRSRWLNAAVVRAEAERLRGLRGVDWVREVRPAARLYRAPPSPGADPSPRPAHASTDYGFAFDQLAAINIPRLHLAGYRGEGVRIALLDAGYNWRAHKSLEGVQVVATRDFINGDEEVGDEADEPVTGPEALLGQNEHGTQVLSVLAADLPGTLVGAAPEAQYLLAKTEEKDREAPIEEYRWIEALEWADSLGAQVVSTSVGWDAGLGYEPSDLDGRTSLAAVAADLAAARGVVVVAAAGNEGDKEWGYVTTPADAAGVLAVGAVSARRRSEGGYDILLAAFSSRGPTADGRIKPDVVAPGVSVYVVSGEGLPSGDAAPYSIEAYTRVRGTSYAAPLVAGVSALLLQIHPDWQPGDVAQALRSTAVDQGPAGPDTLFGWGLVDAEAASGLSLESPSATAVLPPFPNPVRVAEEPAFVHFPVVLAGRQSVSVEVYDLAGSTVAGVAAHPLEAGSYVAEATAVRWQVPTGLASGLCFYRLRVGRTAWRGKIAVLRDPGGS